MTPERWPRPISEIGFREMDVSGRLVDVSQQFVRIIQ